MFFIIICMKSQFLKNVSFKGLEQEGDVFFSFAEIKTKISHKQFLLCIRASTTVLGLPHLLLVLLNLD